VTRQGEVLRRQAIRAEQGQTLILVVFALPLLFALIALVSDGSNLFANKRSVQNVADASVLAAVRELNPCFGSGSVAACTANVQSVATDYCFRNGGNDGTPPCNSVASPPSMLPACNDSSGVDLNSCYKMPYPGSGDYGVQVRIRRNVSLRFAGIVNLPSPVRAKAAATLGLLSAAGNVAPIPIDQNQFCFGRRGTWTPGSGPPPDACFGAPDITVSFDTPGGKVKLMDLDVISTTGPVVADQVNTTDMSNWITFGHPGDLPAQGWYAGCSNSGIHGGIQNAFNKDGITPTLIPLYDNFDTANDPPNWYHVVGFAAFVIDSVRWSNVHQLTGHWVKLIDSGSVSSSGGGSDFGVRGVELDE
jgi:Putative Flp pilus-assembly TadE/G-like